MSDDNDAGLRAVAETTGSFANNFLKTVANEKPGNLITSPLSAQVVLAMAAFGAKGTTATEMRSSLLIPSDDELSQSGYQSVIKSLNAPEGVELRLANRIYMSIEATVKPAYKQLTATKFLSSSQEVDFNDAAGTAGTINAWCEQQTNKRIKDLITPDSLSSDTMMVLVNAVYFKGQWKYKFNPSSTQDRPFHVNEMVTTDVPTMFIKSYLRFGHLSEMSARFIEIPYQGGEVSMFIVLPNEINGLQTVQDNLHKLNLHQSLWQVFPREVKLYLPKFKMESTLDLKSTLQNLGMTEMFEDGANFSGISDIPLKVSKVIQKAFIEVNEEGSQAAAATGVQDKCQSLSQHVRPDYVFEVNRPFYFQIRSTTQNVPLFVGIHTAQY